MNKLGLFVYWKGRAAQFFEALRHKTWGSCLTELSTKKFPWEGGGGKLRPKPTADNLLS